MAAAAANVLFVPPPSSDEDEEEEIRASNFQVARWQTVWSQQPAMYFRDMREVREMCRSVFGVKDHSSLGWQWLAFEKQALLRVQDNDTYFVDDGKGAYVTSGASRAFEY